MAPRIEVHLTLNVDPATIGPDEVADWLSRFQAKWTGSPPGTGPVAPEGADELSDVDAQLARLTSFSPVYAARVTAVHEGLSALGYVPTLPDPRKADRLPSYLSYIDPATGKNLGNLNSGKFYVMRRDLRDDVAANPLAGADTRYAHVALVSDEAAAFVITIGREQKG